MFIHHLFETTAIRKSSSLLLIFDKSKNKGNSAFSVASESFADEMKGCDS